MTDTRAVRDAKLLTPEDLALGEWVPITDEQYDVIVAAAVKRARKRFKCLTDKEAGGYA